MVSTNKRGTILVVDDDHMVLTLLCRILERVFEVVKTTSALEALKLIENGLKPGVIISDIHMPKMNGDEFLEKTIPILPNTTRIVLTADAEPKQVIPYLNRSKALMYIKKPWNDLELFQSVVISYERYEMTVKVTDYYKIIIEKNIDPDGMLKSQLKLTHDLQEELNKELMVINERDNLINKLNLKVNNLTEQIEELNRIEEVVPEKIELNNVEEVVSEEIKEESNLTNNMQRHQNVLALSTIITNLDRFSFLNASYHVAILAKDLGNKLELEQDKIQDIIDASLLCHFPITIMPNELQIAQPHACDQKELDRYFQYFNKSVRILKNFSGYEVLADIIEKIWENRSGFGFPNRLRGSAIPIESQIIGLSVLYISRVYRLTDKGLKSLKQNGKIQQTPNEGKTRHKSTIEFIQRNHHWYDESLFKYFDAMVKDESSYALIPKEDNLEINLLEPKEAGDSKKAEQIILDYYDPDLLLDIKTSSNENVYVTEKEIDPSELNVSMTVSRDVVTDEGNVVIPAKTEINDIIIRNYHQLLNKSKIKDSVWIITKWESEK
jgi:response regulator RpfG family c-di-GMP phosphodiesterase